MRKYKLIKWYPSLPNSCKKGSNIVTQIDEHSYRINDDSIFISNYQVEDNPEFWEEIEELLFTTEDGVDVYRPTKCYMVTKGFFLHYDRFSGQNKDFKYFLSKEKAEEYIIMNKPCLSINEILDDINLCDIQEESLYDLVKEKIK